MGAALARGVTHMGTTIACDVNTHGADQARVIPMGTAHARGVTHMGTAVDRDVNPWAQPKCV